MPDGSIELLSLYIANYDEATIAISNVIFEMIYAMKVVINEPAR